MFEDLRGYLTHLESQGQLLRVAEPVEVTELVPINTPG